MSTTRVAPVAAAAALALCSLTGLKPAAAEAERMHLECENGLVIERTNGSNWWGLNADGSRDGTGYTTRHLVIVDEGGNLVHEHSYGQKTDRQSTTTCVATHFAWTWTVELVQVR